MKEKLTIASTFHDRRKKKNGFYDPCFKNHIVKKERRKFDYFLICASNCAGEMNRKVKFVSLRSTS